MDWSTKFNQFINVLLTQPRWQTALLQGLWNTIRISVFGLIIGIVIGTIVATIVVMPKNKSPLKILEKLCSIYVAIFRGTPMVAQLLIAYYVLCPLFGISGGIDSVLVGTIVFGLNSGAYVSEIMRGGLNSVDPGQMEAGRSLGMTYGQTMMRIVIPQAIKNILPTLGNEFVTLIKETSVLHMITVRDLYTVLKELSTPLYDQVMPYLFLALVYIILVLLITALVKILEKSLGKSDRRTTSFVKKRTFFGLKIGGRKA